jgi:hypothetical protein
MGLTVLFSPFASLWAVSGFLLSPQKPRNHPPNGFKTHKPAPRNTSEPIFAKTPENNDFGAFFRDQAL